MSKLGKDIFNQLMSVLDDIENSIGVSGERNTAKISKISENISEKQIEKVKKVKTEYTKERRELANKVSEMARVANKRLDRLEKNNLEGQSAYKAWYDDGAVRFSVKGKSYQELQREYWRVQKFLDAQTSTVKGARKNLERVAEKVLKLKADDVKKMSLQDLNDATTNFFKLSDAMQNYYEQINDNAKRIDYQKIFTEIQQYFDIEELILMRQDADFDDLIEQMRGYFDAETALEEQINLWE